MPFSITTCRISDWCDSHCSLQRPSIVEGVRESLSAPLLFAAEAAASKSTNVNTSFPSGIVPFPETVRVPLLSSVHVMFSPYAPLSAVSAANADRCCTQPVFSAVMQAPVMLIITAAAAANDKKRFICVSSFFVEFHGICLYFSIYGFSCQDNF